MKRNYLPFFIVLLLIIPLALTSCLSPAPVASTANAAITKDVTDLKAAVTTLKETDAKLQTAINEVEKNKLNRSEYTPSTSTYSKTELYTRTEVEKMIADAKSSLQTQIDSLKANPTTTTPTVPGSATGTVTLNLNPTGLPQTWEIWGNGQQAQYTISISNGMNQWRYVKPIITLSSNTVSKIYGNGDSSLTISCSTSEGTASATAPLGLLLNYYSNGASISSDLSVNNIQFSPPIDTIPRGRTTCTEYASLMTIPISGGNNTLGEFYIGPGQTAMVSINISLRTYTAIAPWKIAVSLTDRGL